VVSDLLMQFFGLASVAVLLPGIAWGIWLASAKPIGRIPARLGAWFVGAGFAAGIVGCVVAPATWPLPSGLGGVIGDLVLALPARLAGGFPTGVSAIITSAILALPTLWMFAFASGILGRRVDEEAPASAKAAPRRMARRQDEAEQYEEEDDDEGSSVL